jgi:hypothetical protein
LTFCKGEIMVENLNEAEWFYLALNKVVTERGWGFQTTIHHETGLSESYVSQILNRKRMPSMKAQVKIARACGYEYGDFLLLGKGDWSPGISKQPHQTGSRIPNPQAPRSNRGRGTKIKALRGVMGKEATSNSLHFHYAPTSPP